jgi:hypothetical protein
MPSPGEDRETAAPLPAPGIFLQVLAIHDQVIYNPPVT